VATASRISSAALPSMEHIPLKEVIFTPDNMIQSATFREH